MPISPDVAWDLAEPVTEVYAEAERALLERIGRSLAAGFDAPGWAETKLLEVQLLQRRTAADLVAAATVGQAHAGVAVTQAWNRGTAVAEADIARSVLGGLRRASAVQSSLDAIVSEVVQSLQAVTQRVLRAVPDVYRSVIRATAPQVLIGTQTRRQAAQAALNQLADRGVTGFTDRRGREWGLDSYVEMATRAATGRAAVDGHVERLAARGFELIAISDAPQECILCRPWEGKVLTTGDRVQAPAIATLEAARAAGLFHPGCRHSTRIYLPGVTVLPTDTEDPQGDRDRQKLRALERRVRAAKRREAVALDPAAAKAARAEVRAAQHQIREHVATSSVRRNPAREQLTRPAPVVRDPFARDSDAQLQDRLMAEFDKGADVDEQAVERISVQMELREKYAGSDISEHYRRRNTVLDEGFSGQSDEEIGQLVEQAIASGDPEAAAFVDEAQLELRNRTYAGKNFHRPVVQKAVRARADSKAARLRAARADYDLLVEQQRGALEAATNGNLIRHDREAEYRKKHGGSELTFIVTADPQTMYRYASEEVRRFYAENQRLTFAEFAVQAGIDDPVLLERAERARRKSLDAATRAEERERPRRR